jgi:excisionase family DNA binding protein
MTEEQALLFDAARNAAKEPTHLTLMETAERLGIGYSTLRRWISEGRLPEELYIRAPRLIRFRRQALEDYLSKKEFVNGTLPTPPKPGTNYG